MLAAGKRENGRWAYGESPEIGKSEQNMRSICGVIADFTPDARNDVGGGWIGP